MRFDDQPESQNIEDRRGVRPGVGPHGRARRARGRRDPGARPSVRVDPSTLLSIVQDQQQPSSQQASRSDPQPPGAEDTQRRFVAQVLGVYGEGLGGRIQRI